MTFERYEFEMRECAETVMVAEHRYGVGRAHQADFFVLAIEYVVHGSVLPPLDSNILDFGEAFLYLFFEFLEVGIFFHIQCALECGWR